MIFSKKKKFFFIFAFLFVFFFINNYYENTKINKFSNKNHNIQYSDYCEDEEWTNINDEIFFRLSKLLEWTFKYFRCLILFKCFPILSSYFSLSFVFISGSLISTAIQYHCL